MYVNMANKKVFYLQTERNNNITLKYFVNYIKKYTRYVLVKMLTATKTLCSI